MSVRAVIALLLEAFFLVMALGSEIREFLIAAACLGGLLVLSFLSAALAIIFLRLKCTYDTSMCEREDDASFNLKIKGFIVLPVICRMTVRTPFKEKRKARYPIYNNFPLDAFNFKRSYDFIINCPHSGNWNIGAKSIRACDIFGFFALPFFFDRREKKEAPISVLPKFYYQNSRHETLGGVDNYNGLSFGNSELGESLDDNRDYRLGDPLRRINWKMSAKLRKPITRLYEKPKKTRVIIALDYYTLESGADCDDMYREAALFIGEYYSDYKNDITVTYLRPEGRTSQFNCNDVSELENLALYLTDMTFKKDKSPLTDIPLNDFEFYERNRLFIITANPESSLVETVKNMNSKGVFVNIIVPKTKFISDLELGSFVTVLGESDEIPQKVGGILC